MGEGVVGTEEREGINKTVVVVVVGGYLQFFYKCLFALD